MVDFVTLKKKQATFFIAVFQAEDLSKEPCINQCKKGKSMH